MDYRKQVFDLLGIEPYEEFKVNNIKSHDIYYLNKNLELYYRKDFWDYDRATERSGFSIREILVGKWKIIKTKQSQKELTKFNFYPFCGKRIERE